MNTRRYSRFLTSLVACVGILALLTSAASAATTTTTVDSAGDVGQDNSLALNSSGFPVISYYDRTNGDLKVAVCGNATCTSGNTLTTVDSAGDVGNFTSLALNSSGFPVISYYDHTNGNLKLAVCGNATCSSGNTLTTVDSGGVASLALNSSGFPVISYYGNGGYGPLKVAVCGNATCSSGNTLTTVDSGTMGAFFLSLVLNSSGFPVISYFDGPNEDLKLAVCGDSTCSSKTLNTVDSVGRVGWGMSLALNSSGFPVISYIDETNVPVLLKLAVCGNATCSSGKTLTTIFSDVWGLSTSLALNSNGIPVISYYGSGQLEVVLCGNTTCTLANTLMAVDITGASGYDNSLVINSNGIPVISYHDYTNGDLKLAVVAGVAPPTGKTPIVFVHGWNGFGMPPPFCSSVQVNPDSYFEQVDENLQAAGYYIGYAYLESSPCYTPPLVNNVDNLEQAIDQAKIATGHSKVILIAHSMGGLVARAYIEGPNYRGDVATLFTFGSPHLGTPDDGIAFLLNGVTFGKACKDYQPAVCDFSVIGMKLFNMNHHKKDEVTYHVISGDAPFFSRSPLGMAMDALIYGPDDGIVPTGSGTNLVGSLDRWTTDEVHGPSGDGFGPRTYFIRDGGVSTSYIQCIKKVLVDGALNCGSVSTASAVAQDIPVALAQRTPFENGTLLSGQTATRTISLEGGPTLFASQWQNGTLAFTLVDPNGQTINPAFAAANPGVVSYTVDTNAATYYFPNTTSGTWQMVLQAVSVPANATFTTFAAFDSNVTLTGSADKQWYTPSASATITATLGGSPSSATVTATILRADGITNTFTLSPIGNGQYQASYTVPNAPGYVEVRLVANGTTASSLSFERGTSLAFQISPNTFILNNTYADTPTSYSGLSTYQFLNVTVGINAAVSGKVGLSADLVDGNGNFVAHGLTIQDVIAGATTLTLQFNGVDIFASQRNGPYTLTNILLTDQSGATLVTQQAQAVYTTAPYLYTNFAPSHQLYLPLILR